MANMFFPTSRVHFWPCHVTDCSIKMFDNCFIKLYRSFLVQYSDCNIVYHLALCLMLSGNYRTVGNFRGVLIFVDFVGPTQTTKNSLQICIDPRKYNFLGLKTTKSRAHETICYVAI